MDIPLLKCLKPWLPAILAGFLAAGCQTVTPPELAGFKFDGCTCFPEGTLEQPDLWEMHCREHDGAYWIGGTRQERKAADLRLRDGIRGEGKPLIAQVAYTGVRIGGTPWLPTGWRWGFGWKKFPRGYRELSEAEKEQVALIAPAFQHGESAAGDPEK